MNSFEEAFSLLIREMETIQRDDPSTTTTADGRMNKLAPRPHSTGFSTIDTINTLIGMYLSELSEPIFHIFLNKESPQNKPVIPISQQFNSISNWDINAVKQWLERIGLSK